MNFTSMEIAPRQIWVDPTPTSGALPHTCTPVRLSSGGQINIGQGTIITLTQDAAYQPPCIGTPVPPPIDPVQPGADLSVFNAKDPWYSSTNPQIYAISAVTIVSYMLVVILLITPRTFFVAGVGGGGGFLGQAGIISGGYESNSVIGIGSRPWLQKIAALSVAVSMTIVTADTFTWAHRQYSEGYEDATELTSKVLGGLETRVVRIISETFLWLAQAQTLIRLFPRHREKLMIKWIAFALIVLELVFSCLDSFVTKASENKKFVSVVPAMNYLFALTLNLCYGGFIIYYVLQKRRFAFYHPHMRNMPLVALLSLTAILIPVVFFVLDLSSPNISGWGTYVRWVGSAAASVVVWEWVERIEALERDEKKGGILGREIFDGDEMLDVTAGSDASWPSSQRKTRPQPKRTRGSASGLSSGWNTITAKARKLGQAKLMRGPIPQLGREPDTQITDQSGYSKGNVTNTHIMPPTPPMLSSAVTSPIDRADTASAGSTLVVVRQHATENLPSSTQADDERHQPSLQAADNSTLTQTQSSQEQQLKGQTSTPAKRRAFVEGLQRLPNPFRRPRETPPPEVARALADCSRDQGVVQASNGEHVGLLERLRLKKSNKANEVPQAVIVVPAPPRRRNSASGAVNESTGDRDNHRTSVRHSRSPSEGSIPRQDTHTQLDAVLHALGDSHPDSSLSIAEQDGS